MIVAALAVIPQDAKPALPKAWLLKDLRIVMRPGEVVEKGSILIRDGKIVAVGEVGAAGDAEVLDCSGLTAYAGLIHPWLRAGGATTPAAGGAANPNENNPNPGAPGDEEERPRGGRRQQDTTTDPAEAMRKRDADPWGRGDNLLSGNKTADAKFENVSAVGSLAKSGFTIAQISTSGGVVGATSAVYTLESPTFSATSVIARPEMVPFSFSSRSGSGYPGALMAVVAFMRQSLADGEWYLRRAKTGQPSDPNPAIANLVPLVSGAKTAVFDELTETNFYIAHRIVQEFNLRPLYGLRSGALAYADLLPGSTVMLRGQIPAKPNIGDNLATVSLNSVRSHFNELQSAKTLEAKGIQFIYAPASTFEPLEGIRRYVQAGLSRDSALAAMTTRPASLLGIESMAGTIEKGKLGNVLLTQGDLFDSSSEVMAVFANGKRVDFKMPDRKKPEELKRDPVLSLMPVNTSVFPAPAETQAAYRLYRNATVWTMGPQGTMKGADVLINRGKIEAVGRGLKAPEGCEVIDATGKHISPGIWDAHSHTAISGGVNEGSNMVTVECRIGDVVNHLDSGIYVQLSGGTVGALQLHGSANAIGGQSNTAKWRWGLRPDQLHIDSAPEGVKFALGQNPIREDTGGFGGGRPAPIGTHLMTWRPRTRMGVEESIRRALQLGKEYNDEWDAFRSGKSKLEPRRDLQLEGLGEIVAGKRWVHSHGYRADEMLMLMRVVKEYGGKLATLQHVLEGYKIADEMAELGVGGSTFSDWWGYKLEAYDAIPYNAALMAERGVVVSVNSDSGDHARRLNQEAAKSMRYGGVSAERALSFVTIEPCRQLGIADRSGSLEVGKDADLAIWTAEPTSIFAVCLETYVDGVKRFDRANDAQQRKDRERELLEAKRVLQGASPAETQASLANSPAIEPTTAKFGIGPLDTRAGTARYPRKSTLIAGATVHPMTGDPFVGDVRISATGKIEAVGKNLAANGGERVDGRGKHLYPGLIDPITTIGLNEIGQVPASDDSSERGSFHPDYKVERAINPEWETMAVARQQGILTVLVRPGGSGAAGQAALINTEGYTWEDLTVKSGAALAYLGASRGFGGGEDDLDGRCRCEELGDVHEHDDMMAGLQQGGGGSQSASQMLQDLTKALDDSRDYLFRQRSAAPEKPVPVDHRQEAMAMVAARQMPVMLSVNSAAEIRSAVEWAEKERVQIVLYGCSGAGEIAEWLAAKQVPVILNAVYRTPSGDLPVDWYYSLPARLSKAGVKFCLTTDNDKNVRQLRDQAGWAAAYGMDREEAARLVTLRAAQVLGIDNRLGSIAAGMDGTLILTDGEIVETKTNVLRAWIEGREIPLTNKQTRLYDKYRTRPKKQ